MYTGLGNKDLDFGGKAITVRSQNGPASCIIDCEGTGRGFYFHSGEGPDSVVDGFTITNGVANGAGLDGFGGGILIDGSATDGSATPSHPTIINCLLAGNSATHGGGIMITHNCMPIIGNCTFSANSCASNGGGMHNEVFSSPSVSNCSFSGNTAGVAGGGIFNRDSNAEVTNCMFSQNTGGGGGMSNDNSSPVVTACMFTENIGIDDGGGMFNGNGSNPMVIDCMFHDNIQAADGAGMYNSQSSPTVQNCVFIGNSVNAGVNRVGGGMANVDNSNPHVSGCHFAENNVTGGSVNNAGGGMFNSNSSPTVVACVFTGNTSSGNGGGMANYDGSHADLTNCWFGGNEANQGGGMFNFNSSPMIVNTVFTGNFATVISGGLDNSSASNPTLINCTFSRNSTGGPGGGMTTGAGSNASLVVANCIFWQNQDSGGMDESAQIYVGAGLPTVGFTCIQGLLAGGAFDSGMNTDNIGNDPQFVDADGTDDIAGTEDDNVRLLAGSPCIDAGDNSVVTEPTDLDGNPRILNGTVDMGAYEFQPTPVSVDIKPGSCPNSFNPDSNGVLPVAVLGTADFDAAMIDIASILLSRADGVGGQVAPHEGPPGPHSTLEDVATPFEGETCDCHELGGDGIVDLSLKFKTDDVVELLELDDLPAGALVELVVSGNLLDGTPFSGSDCIRLVPPGTPDALLSVSSNLTGAWVDVSPLDNTLDGGGFANFVRNFPETTVVTLSAASMVNNKPLLGWMVDGQFIGANGATPWLPSATLKHTLIAGQAESVEVVYGPATKKPKPPIITPTPSKDGGISSIGSRNPNAGE